MSGPSRESADALAEERLSRAIAASIRRARATKAWTVRELANRAGLSRAVVSSIEQGSANPSMKTLLKLATALDMALTDILQPSAPHLEIVRRADRKLRVTSDGQMRRRLLFASEERRRIEIYEIELPAGARSVWESRGGMTLEYVIVEAGRLTVGPADHEVELSAGDALVFRADRRHVYEARGGLVRLICVLAHERA